MKKNNFSFIQDLFIIAGKQSVFFYNYNLNRSKINDNIQVKFYNTQLSSYVHNFTRNGKSS